MKKLAIVVFALGILWIAAAPTASAAPAPTLGTLSLDVCGSPCAPCAPCVTCTTCVTPRCAATQCIPRSYGYPMFSTWHRVCGACAPRCVTTCQPVCRPVCRPACSPCR